ncbi:MAG: DUF4317 domain-containing protein [Lachnospiraceae bacterium]|nr:DUF4317 domain-containing protein [Lachnospiraceae bacterium]
MNKKEIASIRKTMNADKTTAQTLCVCHVNIDREVTMFPSRYFGRIPEEEADQYLELFRKVFSGKIGTNLHTLHLPTAEAGQDETQDLLYRCLKEKCSDEDSVEELFAAIAENYPLDIPYCILALYAELDVFTPQGEDAFDGGEQESENVFPHMVICLCPIAVSKPSLVCREGARTIDNLSPATLISKPVFGFLYPAFHDGGADIHNVLFYMKKQGEPEEVLIRDMFGCDPPLTETAVRGGFETLVAASLEESCSFETVAAIQNEIAALAEEAEDEESNLIGKEQLRGILAGHMPRRSKQGAEDDLRNDSEEASEEYPERYSESGSEPSNKFSAFDEVYGETFRDGGIPLSQVVPAKVTVKSSDIMITCPPELSGHITVGEVDGEPCIIVRPNGGVTLNGIPIRMRE